MALMGVESRPKDLRSGIFQMVALQVFNRYHAPEGSREFLCCALITCGSLEDRD